MRTGPKEWSPKNPEPAEKILETLRQLAPSVAFEVLWDEDPNHMWDGDGPDPRDKGYVAYDVEVRGTVIMEGELIALTETLGGVYDKPEELDLEIGGYLPQMLEELVERLGKRELQSHVLNDLKEAEKYLKEVLKVRYNRQTRGRGGE